MTKYDKVLIIVVLIISLSFIFISGRKIINYSNVYAEIFIDGKLENKYTLDNNFEKTITIETEYGINIIEIKDKKVKMIESSCPDKLCIKQGEAHSPGQLIVCLPNKLVVEITGENDDEDEIDSISH